MPSFIEYTYVLWERQRCAKSEPEIMKVEFFSLTKDGSATMRMAKLRTTVLRKMHFVAYAKVTEPSFCIWMMLNKQNVKLNLRMVES